MLSALKVFCPTCMASPGRTCRAVVGRRGTPCPPHPRRRVSASGFQLVAHTREELEEKALAVCADSNDPLGDQEIAERAGLTLPEALPVIQKLHADGTLPCARGCSFCSEPEEGAP